MVAVNGQPAKGIMTRNAGSVVLTTAATPGQSIADAVRNAVTQMTFEIHKNDGTEIGTIVSNGFSGGPTSPGAALSVTGSNFAISGGSGAFLWVRGQIGKVALPTNERMTSITEYPANRLRNGGGANQWLLQAYPMIVPQTVTTSAGPAVFHSDSTPVTAATP